MDIEKRKAEFNRYIASYPSTLNLRWRFVHTYVYRGWLRFLLRWCGERK